MPEEISRWINKLKEKSIKQDEAPYHLEEYFDSGLNLDDEVARGLNIKLDDLRIMRKERDS